MGHNTTILIINDKFEEIEKNPEEFIKQIKNYMEIGGDIKVGNSSFVGTVMKTGNTDIPRLYFVEGNWITEIGKHSKAFKKADGRPEIIKLLKERIKIAENKIKEFKDILKTL